MTTFSERNGYKTMSQIVQVETLDDDTRRRIWNVVQPLQNRLMQGSYDTPSHQIVERHLFTDYFDQYLGDQVNVAAFVWDGSRAAVLEGEWNQVFDYLEALIEAIASSGGVHGGITDKVVTLELNKVFVRTLADYRVIEGHIVRISAAAEVEAVTEAATVETVLGAARHHIERATAALSNRTNPDYVNVIRDSIHAAESFARHLTGKNTLGAAIDELKRTHSDLHPALIAGWKSLYGWSSDDAGIRHGGALVADPSFALARWLLVSCSAFLTYLAAEDDSRARDIDQGAEFEA
jgi:hypothetical protein